MKANEFAAGLELKVFCPDGREAEITGCYIGDLLSWVMGRAREGDAWVTIMSNLNVVGVAVLSDVACIILAEGVTPDEVLLTRAVAEGIAIFGSEKSAYELAGEIHGILSR
jgi:hypothetical protein